MCHGKKFMTNQAKCHESKFMNNVAKYVMKENL